MECRPCHGPVLRRLPGLVECRTVRPPDAGFEVDLFVWMLAPWLAQAPAGEVTASEQRFQRSASDVGVEHAPVPKQLDDALFGDASIVRCQVRFTIDPAGSVERVDISGDACGADFESRAKEAAMLWRFKELTDSDGPAPSVYSTEFTFRRGAFPVRPFEASGVLETPTPKLPELARWAVGLEVDCSAFLHVDVDGRVVDTELVSCPSAFASELREVSADWRFSPWLDADGQPTASVYPLTFTFRTPDYSASRLTVEIPGLLTVSIDPRPTPPIPPLPEHTSHTEERVQVRIQGYPSGHPKSSIPAAMWKQVRALGTDGRFEMMVLVIVDHRGRPKEVEVLDGHVQLHAYIAGFVMNTRFEVDGLERGEQLRFLHVVPLRLRAAN